jgi:hypothetical protein
LDRNGIRYQNRSNKYQYTLGSGQDFWELLFKMVEQIVDQKQQKVQHLIQRIQGWIGRFTLGTQLGAGV